MKNLYISMAVWGLATCLLICIITLMAVSDIRPTCDLSSTYLSSDFVGHKITVPVSYIDECLPWVEFGEYGEEEAAILRLTAVLPTLSPLEESVPNENSDEIIQIWIRGLSIRKATYKSPTAPPEKFTGYELRIDPESYTSAKDNAKHFTYSNIKFYERASEGAHGLVLYKAITPIRSHSTYDGKMIYVKEDGADKDHFVLSCGGSYSHQTCRSTGHNIKSNVRYFYSYSSKHLAHAERIDAEVQKLVLSFF